MSALDRVKNIARGISADPPVKEKPGVVSDMFLPSPEEQLRNTQLAANGGVVGRETARQAALKDYDAGFKEYLKGPGVGKAAYRNYNKLKESQEKLSFIPRTLSEVITSPLDVGFKAGEMTDKRRNLLLNEDQRKQQWYSLGGSALDMGALATLGKYLPAAQGLKTAFKLSKKAVPFAKKVGLLGAAGIEILQQAFEDQFGYASGFKEKNQNKN